jgi:hypothetical protein
MAEGQDHAFVQIGAMQLPSQPKIKIRRRPIGLDAFACAC